MKRLGLRVTFTIAKPADTSEIVVTELTDRPSPLKGIKVTVTAGYVGWLK
jgi:hypothetical protein